METFAVDKEFYDIGSPHDLKDIWDDELDPTMQEVLKINGAGDLTVEWSLLERELPGVVLHDRLMTDAALGSRPIKAEHSYSLVSEDSLPESPLSMNKMNDMEDECFPAISMNTACRRFARDTHIIIKDEPTSEPDSPQSSCPSSPQSIFISHTEDVDMEIDIKPCQSILRHKNILLKAPSTIFSQRLNIPKVDIKLEPGIAFNLPPTPPSSSSSSDDSEDNTTLSQPASPLIRKINNRVILSGSHQTVTRQPIHTPLISSQPKGSIGILHLTEEEKRTLIAEGYPVPTRLPLTKAEEKSLKKIRRKIKNKISAQESRRKKKEYMDQLERKVELLVTENNDFRKKIDDLEDSNSSLMNQLVKLQEIVSRTHPHMVKQSSK